MSNVTMRVDEELVLAVRKHPICVTVPLLFSFLLLVGAFFLLFPLFSLGTIGVVLFSALLVFSLVVGIRSWILWRSTQLLVTTQRVVDVDRRGMFRWVISDVTFDTIADISYEIAGPLQVLCRAGNVFVTGIGNGHAIVAHFLPRPAEVRETIMEQYSAAYQRAGQNTVGKKQMGEALDPEDERAVQRYAHSLQKRRAMQSYFKGEKEG
jgi:hypothetical protein